MSRTAKALVGAALLAILVRLPFALGEGDVTTRFSEVSDVRGYHELARSLVESGVYGYGGHPTAFRPPLYPVFLAGVYEVTGSSIRAARLVQSLVFVALLPILYLIGLRLVGTPGALAACFLASVYPMFVHYSTELLSESLAVVLVPASLLCFLLLDERPGVLRGALAGISLAAALMVRPQLLPTVVAMVAVVAAGQFGRGLRPARLWAAAALLGALSLSFLPWVARNAEVFGAFIPFGTYGGYALYDGATEYRTLDWNAHKQQFRADLGVHRSDFERPDTPGAPDELALDRKAKALAGAEIRARPGRYLLTLLFHAEVILIGLHQSDLRAIASGRAPLTLAAGTLPYWAVLCAALAWLIPHRGHLSRAAVLLSSLTLLSILTMLPFNGAIRYRVPVLDPLLLVFAGAAVADWAQRRRGVFSGGVDAASPVNRRESPSVSVVVPMRNEAAHIGACLEGLAAQDFPAEHFEVVVVDGDSTDGSTEVVSEWARRRPNIRLCRNPERTTPFGLNAGIREARNDVIIILGAHAVVEPSFIRENVLALEASGADAVGGVIDAAGDNRFGEAVAAAVSSRFGVGAISFRQATREGFVDTIAYAAYSRRVFERIGLFDEEMVRDQDDELNYRLRKHGGRIFLTPRIRTRYTARASLTGLWRQYFAYGYWKVRVLQKHPLTMKPRHFVPALSIGAGALALATSIFERRALWVAIPLATAYAGAVLLTAARVASRIGWGRFSSLLVIFPILHVSYGAGFLLGLIRFLPRWWTPETPPPALPSRCPRH